MRWRFWDACPVLNGFWSDIQAQNCSWEQWAGSASIDFCSIQDGKSSMWIWPIRWLLTQPIRIIQRKSAWQGAAAAVGSRRCLFSSWSLQPITNVFFENSTNRSASTDNRVWNQCAKVLRIRAKMAEPGPANGRPSLWLTAKLPSRRLFFFLQWPIASQCTEALC